MNKLILVPVIGTVAALIAIFVFHREREKKAPPQVPPPIRIDEPAPQPRPPRPPPPRPETTEWYFNLEADGALTGADSGERFATVAEALGVIAPEGTPRPKVVLGPGDGVTDEQLEQAVAALSERCDVRVFRRD